MVDRRTFIRQMTAAGALSAAPDILLSQPVPAREKIWACLLHLSFNMWEDHNRIDGLPESETNRLASVYDPALRLDESVWNDCLKKMVSSGMNMIVIDLGDGIQYESHPEIPVKNAWSKARLRKELARLREMGLEPIPKLNFSACHDVWLGKYSRMVSTEPYYSVCKNLIEEAIDLFDKPRFFHLGMDEEVAEYQHTYDYVVVRNHDLWWKDLYFFIEQVEKKNVRPWVWSDYLWHHPDTFFKKMPKSVMQSNWYYGDLFDNKQVYTKAYGDLDAHGYDQIPTCAYYESRKNQFNAVNTLKTVQFCKDQISDERLYGFLQTNWRSTTERYKSHIVKGIELLGEGKNWYTNNAGK